MQPGFEYNCPGNVVNTCAWIYLQNATCKHPLPRVVTSTGSFAWVSPTSDYQWKEWLTVEGISQMWELECGGDVYHRNSVRLWLEKPVSHRLSKSLGVSVPI